MWFTLKKCIPKKYFLIYFFIIFTFLSYSNSKNYIQHVNIKWTRIRHHILHHESYSLTQACHPKLVSLSQSMKLALEDHGGRRSVQIPSWTSLCINAPATQTLALLTHLAVNSIPVMVDRPRCRPQWSAPPYTSGRPPRTPSLSRQRRHLPNGRRGGWSLPSTLQDPDRHTWLPMLKWNGWNLSRVSSVFPSLYFCL